MRQKTSWMGFLVSLALASTVQADSVTERNKIMRSLDSGLVTIERELTDFDRDRDASALRVVTRALAKMNSDLRSLARVTDGDRDAKHRVKAWPRVIDDLEAALKQLAQLKDRQYAIDELGNICVDLEKKLEKEIEEVLHSEAVYGVDTLPAWGKKFGAMTADQLFDAKELVRNMGRANSSVGRFAPRGEWEKVQDQLHDAADGIYRHLYNRNREAVEDCEDLAKEEKHPAIVKAVTYLAREAGDEFKKFKRSIDAWEEEAAGVFRLNCEGLEEMWNASCRVDHEPDETLSAAAKRSIQAAVDKYSKQILDRVEEILETYDGIEGWVDHVLKECQKPAARGSRRCDGLEAGVKREFARIKKEHESLLKMRTLRKKKLEGGQHPKMIFATSYGKRKHEDMAVEHYCDVDDVAFPGGPYRPDCVRADGCYVLEFKPDDPDRIAEGNKQVERDRKLVSAYYEKVYANHTVDSSGKKRFSNPSKYGGQDIMEDFIEEGCFDKNGKMKMNAEVVTYDRCDRRFRCWE